MYNPFFSDYLTIYVFQVFFFLEVIKRAVPFLVDSMSKISDGQNRVQNWSISRPQIWQLGCCNVQQRCLSYLVKGY